MLSADGCLESRRPGAWMATSQHHPHATLAVYTCSRGPVHFVSADHPAAPTGQFVVDSAVLVGVITHLQNHARFQHKDWYARCRATAASHRVFTTGVAGVDELRIVLSARLMTGCDAYAAHGQLRNATVVIVVRPNAGAFVRALIIGVVLHPRTSKEVPVRSVGGRDLWDLHVIHQAQLKHAFALERGTRTARRQHNDLPRPERRNHPFDDVALGMTFAPDVAFFIDFIAARGDHLGVERHVAVRQSDAIEHQLHVALAPEMSGVLGRLQMADEIASAWKRLLAEFRYRVQMTKHGISDRDG